MRCFPAKSPSETVLPAASFRVKAGAGLPSWIAAMQEPPVIPGSSVTRQGDLRKAPPNRNYIDTAGGPGVHHPRAKLGSPTEKNMTRSLTVTMVALFALVTFGGAPASGQATPAQRCASNKTKQVCR